MPNIKQDFCEIGSYPSVIETVVDHKKNSVSKVQCHCEKKCQNE